MYPFTITFVLDEVESLSKQLMPVESFFSHIYPLQNRSKGSSHNINEVKNTSYIRLYLLEDIKKRKDYHQILQDNEKF